MGRWARLEMRPPGLDGRPLPLGLAALAAVLALDCDGGGEGSGGGGDAAPDGLDAASDGPIDGEADVDGAEPDADDGGPAAGEPWPLPEDEEVAFLVEELTFSEARLCDLDGDGSTDNAFADLGSPTSSDAAVLFGRFLSAGLESPAGMGLLFVEPDEGPGDRGLVVFQGADAVGEGSLFVPAESLDDCGEPLYVLSDVSVDADAVRASGGELPLSLGPDLVSGAASVEGRATLVSSGPRLTLDACVSPTIAELGRAAGPAEAGGRSLLDVLAAGGASFGQPGVPGLLPNVDLDGDGLELVLVDDDGRVSGCVDGDRTAIAGASCWQDPRMADGFGFVLRLVARWAELGGRGPGWLGCCEAGLSAESALGPRWIVEPVDEAIIAGSGATCHLAVDGSARCWGANGSGLLGYGHTETVGDDETPASQGPVDVGGPVASVDLSVGYSCAALADGTARCWGGPGAGQLGSIPPEAIGDDEVAAAAPLVEVGGPVAQIRCGKSHTCALLEGGAVRCWGSAADGLLGYGNVDDIGDDETPASAGDVPLSGPAVDLSIGPGHACVVLEGGGVQCWGSGDFGRLGYGTTESVGDDETPASIGPVELGGPAIAVSCGWFHTCALLADGGVRCWGSGADGQLGHGTVDDIGDDETPDTVGPVELGGAALAVGAGVAHTCALLESGGVRCWGSGAAGALGYGTTDTIGDDEVPSTVGEVPLGARATALDVGAKHSCVILEGGQVRCWGVGTNGALGLATTDTIGDDETPDSVGPVDLGICQP